MKKLLFWVFFFSIIITAQDEKKIDSKVIEATVFKNRALVTREGETELSPGIHNLVFSNLPVDLLDESVRVSASGNGVVKILDVKVEQRFTTETQQERIRNLELKIDSLNQLKQVVLDQISIYESKKEFVESLKDQSGRYIGDKLLLSMNTKSMNDIINYVDDNLNGIYKGLREENRKKLLYEQQINILRTEINEEHGKKTKNYKEVLVTLETSQKEKIKLHPSYLVQSASWYPLYDARVITDTKTVELSYYGMVNQQTGEEWKDISLKISTAEPMSVKTLPEIDRWFLDIRPIPVKQTRNESRSIQNSELNITYDQNWGIPAGKGSVSGYITDRQTGTPLVSASVILGQGFGSTVDLNGKFFIPNVPVGQYTLTASMIGYYPVNTTLQVTEKNIANINISLMPAPVSGDEIYVIGEKPKIQKYNSTALSSQTIERLPGVTADIQYTNIYAKDLSTSFEIPSKSTIPSDNGQHKVTIAVSNAPIEFKYTSIPKITPSVYVKGKVTNNKEYPLLEGEISIFVDNDFINRTYLNTIVPSDTLSLALGIDERIQIKKVLINKFQESKGLLGGSRQITYDYEIQVTNNRKTEESVLIYDQLPIAMNEEIKVELLEPEKTEKELGNDKKLEWNTKLAPGEKKIIPLKYTVTYPNNLAVYGLE